MHIAIDYNAALRQGGGIGRLVRETTRFAAAAAPQQRFSLWYAARGLDATSPLMQEFQALCRRLPNITPRPIPLSERLLTILWQRLQVPLAVERFVGPVDLVHGPDFVVPPTYARSLITIHDVAYEIHPETASRALRRYLRTVVPRNVRRADHIHVNSAATQRDMERFFGVPRWKSTIIYCGSGAEFYPRSSDEIAAIKQRLGLPERYLLNVGTVQPRKNIERLIEAYAALGALTHATPLVIAGKRGWLAEPIYQAVERYGLQERIKFLDFVPDAALPGLYAGALALVYPSLYEGFGIPICEAQACGTLVVTSQVSSMPEIAGDAALLVDPLSTESITESLRRVLTEPELQTWAHKVGPRQAARFNWQHSGLEMLRLYNWVAQTDDLTKPNGLGATFFDNHRSAS